MRAIPLLLSASMVAACADSSPQREEVDRAEPNEAPRPATEVASTDANLVEAEPQTNSEREPLIGEELALAEWRIAANRNNCAPLALSGTGGVPAKARRADFSQGWGVAFDRPGLRSAFGFAGAGPVDQDRLTDTAKRQALADQWPHTRSPKGLPDGSLAGYGLMGAKPYASSNPRGRGEHSLAYLRIPGQSCLYNVWSKISRDHLETILDSLRVVETG